MDRDFPKVIQKDIYSKGVGFPKALRGQSWRSFIKASIFISLIIYGLVSLVRHFLFLPYSLVHYIKLFCITLFIFSVLGYLNNLRLRAKYFEREKIANDKRAERLRKEFLKQFAVEKILKSKSTDSKKDDKDELFDELKSRINNVEVLVNTRQSLSHSLFRHYTILVHAMEDTLDQTYLNGLLVNGNSSSVKDKDIGVPSPYITVSAQRAFYNYFKYNFIFSTVKSLKNGDLYIEAVENLGADPYYFDKRITDLENWKKTSEMTHSVPYLPAKAFGIDFSGFIDHTEENSIKKEKATKWLNENMDSIQEILTANGFDAVFIPSSVTFRQSSAELDFTIPTNLKASKDTKNMEVAEVIDKKLQLRGSTLTPNLDTIHLSLSLPDGKLPNGNDRKNDKDEIEDFRQKLNLEDVFRSLYG